MAFYSLGCSQLWVTDGIWKLRFPHCMHRVKVTYVDIVILSNAYYHVILPYAQYIVKQIPALTLPDVCTLSPLPGKAFCAQHTKVLEEHSPPIPTDIRGFLSFCGVLPSGRLYAIKMHDIVHDNNTSFKLRLLVTIIITINDYTCMHVHVHRRITW